MASLSHFLAGAHFFAGVHLAHGFVLSIDGREMPSLSTHFPSLPLSMRCQSKYFWLRYNSGQDLISDYAYFESREASLLKKREVPLDIHVVLLKRWEIGIRKASDIRHGREARDLLFQKYPKLRPERPAKRRKLSHDGTQHPGTTNSSENVESGEHLRTKLARQTREAVQNDIAG